MPTQTVVNGKIRKFSKGYHSTQVYILDEE